MVYTILTFKFSSYLINLAKLKPNSRPFSAVPIKAVLKSPWLVIYLPRSAYLSGFRLQNLSEFILHSSFFFFFFFFRSCFELVVERVSKNKLNIGTVKKKKKLLTACFCSSQWDYVWLRFWQDAKIIKFAFISTESYQNSI